MSGSRTYSVSELSKLAGVSVRTLHHYDQVGLLKPYRRDNGYREYSYEHLVTLQQIIIYRELDFSLDDIGKLLNADNFDLLTALESQKELLLERQSKTNSMINSIEVTMANTRAERNSEILFEDLPKGKLESLEKLSLDAYGFSVTEGMKMVSGNLTEDQARAWKKENDAFGEEFVKAISMPAGSQTVQNLVKRFYHLSEVMLQGDDINLDYEKSVIIADKLINDSVMQEIYSLYHPDFSKHLGEAMLVYAEANLKYA